MSASKATGECATTASPSTNTSARFTVNVGAAIAERARARGRLIATREALIDAALKKAAT